MHLKVKETYDLENVVLGFNCFFRCEINKMCIKVLYFLLLLNIRL